MNTQSFIDQALTDLSEKSNAQAYIARTIQQQSHDNVLNRIALTYSALSTLREEAKNAGVKPAAKPEMMLNFMQNLMNKICWNARRVYLAQQRSEAENQANGLDFSQDVSEEAGLAVRANTQNLAAIVKDDYHCLVNVFSWLSTQMSYLRGVNNLYVYADYEFVQEAIDDAWQLKAAANTFDEALDIMALVLDEINEQETAKVTEQAASIDFSSGVSTEAA